MDNEKSSFATFFRNKRKEAMLTQQELSERTQVPKSTISGIETGRFLPAEETINAVADVLNVSSEELLREKENNVVAPFVSQRIAKRGTTSSKDGITSEELLSNGVDLEEFDDFGRSMADANTSLIKKQLILIDYFNQLSEVNQIQIIEIVKILLNNQK
ncbi:TPA: helix-turn-helix transcriptional regulator [Enterococcus faecalis]|nr:helix-turn-helix transcriptional regulator [Enterococcus faecalis]